MTQRKGKLQDQKLVSLLNKHGVKPAVLAKALKVSPQMAGAILRGERGIARWRQQAAAALVNLTVDDLSGSKPHTLAIESVLPMHPGGLIGISATGVLDATTIQEMSNSATRLREIATELVQHADGITGRLTAIVGDLSPYVSHRDHADRGGTRKARAR